MNNFSLKDLDGSGNELVIVQGWDGDVHFTIKTPDNKQYSVRIGMCGNPGGQDFSEIDGGNYLLGAIRNLSREIQYQNGLIDKEEINSWRSMPRVTPLIEAWFKD